MKNLCKFCALLKLEFRNLQSQYDTPQKAVEITPKGLYIDLQENQTTFLRIPEDCRLLKILVCSCGGNVHIQPVESPIHANIN